MMDSALQYIICFFAYIQITVHAVPPAACFADFRWDDCGKPPVPVMYYWKPGSRCEVGMWRGCLPNINMFQYEYECVSTCIFTVRAGPEDYHEINIEPDYDANGVPVTTLADYDPVGNQTDLDNIEDSSTTAAAVNDAVTDPGGSGDSDASGATGDAAETTASAAPDVVTTTTAAPA